MKTFKRIVIIVLLFALFPTAMTAAALKICGAVKGAANMAGDKLKEKIDEKLTGGSDTTFSGELPASETADSVDAVADNKSLNFVLTGIDSVGNNSDVIMLVRFDTDTSRISVVQIPRDTYINCDKYGFHKINAVYTFGYNSAVADGKKGSEAIKAGNRELCSFIKDATGFDADYFVSVEKNGFIDIVNSIGGVDVTVPSALDYDDESQDLHIHFPKGDVHLSGEDAQLFVRYRSGYINADYGRMDAQKIFLSAMLKKIKTNLTLPQAAALTATLYSKLTTDIPLGTLVSLAPSCFHVSLDNINMITLKGRSVTVGKTMYEVQNKKYTFDVFNRYLMTGLTDVSELDPDVMLGNAENDKINAYYTDTAPYSTNGYSADDTDAIGRSIPIK